MSDTIPTIKSRLTCVEYARRHGLPIAKPGDRCVSPLRSGASNKHSFVVYNDFFFDFGGNTGGDVIDLCALLDHNGDRRAAIHALAHLTGAETEPSRDWVKATSQLNNLIQRWHEALLTSSEHLDYLHSRHITDESISALKIGYTGRGEPDGYCARRIAIPYWKNGYVYSYVARCTRPDQEPKYLKRRNDDLSDRSAPWGMSTLHRKDKPLIIAEGSFDALAFYQEQFPVLATMGGHFSREQIATVLSAAKNFPAVYLTFDADSPGADFTLGLAKQLFTHHVPFRVASIPRPHKDVSDYYSAGGSLDALLSDAQDGPTVLCQSIKDEEEFKRFAYQASRFIDSPELAKMFKAVRDTENFDAAWLAEVQANCKRPPSEDIVARQVTEAHQLRYLENVGFYEYSRGCWRKIEDTQVMAYIGAELGRYRTGARLSSIIKIIRTDTLTDQPFDRKPVFNFINGTLDLSDPPIFRAHDPADLCSIQAGYAYDPTASSPDWLRFILDVSAGDDKRAQLLQEIAGYILFPDCSLEKIFALQGSGGNGKSVYLNVLQAVYGKENTSSITATGICDNFQRIYLSTSLLNIASEIKSNLSGAEEYLKQIASGETISACYKGKNFVQFQPRCKLLFATNGQLKSQDTSDGLLRRLCIVNFTQSFVDHPSKPNERRRDTTLTPRLLDNLPAIFNWCLEGYLILKRTRDFTTMEDEETTKAEFMEASNPLITFLKDTEPQGRISKNELYQKYTDWCEEAGHKRGSRTYLLREVRKLFPDGTKEVDTYVDGERFKGFVFPVVTPDFESELPL
nr:MAG TPA: dsDNA helicase [Caudoviricetes sp.]